MDILFRKIDSPLGAIRIAARGDLLCGLWFVGQKYDGEPYQSDTNVRWARADDNMFLMQVATRLAAYFKHPQLSPDLPLVLPGTPFQQIVWRELSNIPGGETITYRELAIRIGKPRAIRAAAAAVGRNPVSIIVPCHRVVGSNGSLTGYAGGIERKESLLKMELAHASLFSPRQPA
ncbi:MAG: methylated-DNA--[protein]-cysteine S-methyltransferase [Burkholderiaceae bacterium]